MFFIVMFFGPLHLANSQVNCLVNQVPFGHGEELKYVVSYTWFFVWTDVGEVTFTVSNDQKFGNNAFHLSAIGKSFKFYDWFFKVRDVYESWVDQNSFQPLYFNRNINEGGYTKENEYTFDWNNNFVKARIRRIGGENRYYDIQVEPCTFDVVTAIYYSRSLDYAYIDPNKSFPVRVILDREFFDIKYTFLQKENIKVKETGTFSALKFRVELVAGDVFKEGQYLFVWVTDDENRIPVYIESPIRVGSIKARLVSWEGIKFPLNSIKP